MPPEFQEEIKKLEAMWKRKVNTHAWVVTVITIITLLFTIFVVYGKSITALTLNEIEHNSFKSKEAIIEVKVDNVIKNQNMIYYNLLVMAKRQGIKLTSKEEMFLNNPEQIK